MSDYTLADYLQNRPPPPVNTLGGTVGLQSRPQPHVAPVEPTTAQRLADWLASWGWPRWQAERIGAVAPYTPMGGAFDAGRSIARGVADRDPWAAAQGVGGLGLAAWPFLAGARPPIRAPQPAPAATPWAAPTGRVTTDAVEDALRQMGVTDIRRQPASTGTEYLYFANPLDSEARRWRNITVRNPADAHAAQRRWPPGNIFDLAGSRARGRVRGHHTEFNPTLNVGGGRFNEWENLLPALQWRLSRAPSGGNWLVREDQVPRGLREAPLVDPRIFPRTEPPTASAGPDPRQLRLLGTAGAGAMTAPWLLPQPAEVAW